MAQPVSLIIIGAGGRGNVYARHATQWSAHVRVVGVAEPRPYYRQKMAADYAIPPENAVAGWQELADRPRFADAVFIATPDALHAGPAVAFARQGYAILLEKPMAPTAGDCRRIVQAVRENGNLFAVCHVLRYTAYTQKVKALVDSGLIGDVISIDHIEPVGHWHMAHSFVRGNWRNVAESSFMLLAKSCHDIDWLRYIVGQRCVQVSSFGALNHFKSARKPVEAGNALRCLDCAYEPNCPYSAKKLYLGMLGRGDLGWPLYILTPDLTESGVMAALQEGPYGRCVYECDNDVVDHQVVSLRYENDVTATFTMIGLSEIGHRRTTLFGTRGELRGNGEQIIHFDFLSGKTSAYDTRPAGATAADGHGGGDAGLVRSFLQALTSGDRTPILSGADETLETHLTTFAAEQARLEGRVIDVGSFSDSA
ncbi:MAG: Gfo/Idh/MocA family protein [Chloroflexota bacterium]